MKNIVKISLLLIAFSFAATSCNKDKEGWRLFFGYTTENLIGEYFPNEELWENELPEDYSGIVDGEKAYVYHIPMVYTEAVIQEYNPGIWSSNLQLTLYNVDSTFSTLGTNFTFDAYNSINNYSFQVSNNFDITVYKDKDGRVRLHGCRRVDRGTETIDYHTYRIWEYYYFDIVK